MCVNEEVKHVPEWAKQYVSDEELAMQDAEALRAAGDELAVAMDGLLDRGRWDISATAKAIAALHRWREATG